MWCVWRSTGSGRWRIGWWRSRACGPLNPPFWGTFSGWWAMGCGDIERRRIRGTTRALVESACRLRRELTPAEGVLWEALQGRGVAGLRFRCQHSMGPFVADFFCPAAKLIVEVDGAIHDQQLDQDAARTEYLTMLGYHVLRFRNEEVLHTLPAVLARIEQAALAVPSEQRMRRGTQASTNDQWPRTRHRRKVPQNGGFRGPSPSTSKGATHP